VSTFTHTVALLKLYPRMKLRDGIFMHTKALNDLPSKTYEEGTLVKVNGVPLYRLVSR
jgi:hypothetical protein